MSLAGAAPAVAHGLRVRTPHDRTCRARVAQLLCTAAAGPAGRVQRGHNCPVKAPAGCPGPRCAWTPAGCAQPRWRVLCTLDRCLLHSPQAGCLPLSGSARAAQRGCGPKHGASPVRAASPADDMRRWVLPQPAPKRRNQPAASAAIGQGTRLGMHAQSADASGARRQAAGARGSCKPPRGPRSLPDRNAQCAAAGCLKRQHRARVLCCCAS